MQPRRKGAIWSNDTLQTATGKTEKPGRNFVKESVPHTIAGEEEEDDDLFEDLSEKPVAGSKAKLRQKKGKSGDLSHLRAMPKFFQIS